MSTSRRLLPFLRRQARGWCTWVLDDAPLPLLVSVVIVACMVAVAVFNWWLWQHAGIPCEQMGVWPWPVGDFSPGVMGPLAGAGVSFVYPVAYDWKKGAASVARLLPYGDEHIVAWDSAGRTWGGAFFTPPDENGFRREVEAECFQGVISTALAKESFCSFTARRLRIFTGNFSVPGGKRLGQQRCERRALVNLAREGNWVAEVDADEEWVGPHDTVRAMTEMRQVGNVGCLWGDYAHVYKVIGEAALVLTAGGPVAIGDRRECGGVKGAGGRRRRLPDARVINWWLHDRDPQEMRRKLGAVSYMEGHDPGLAIDIWNRATLEDAGALPSVGGTLRGRRLQAISVADLRAGNWESLTW